MKALNDLDLTSNQIKNLADGTDPQDAVTLAQLQAGSGGGGSSLYAINHTIAIAGTTAYFFPRGNNSTGYLAIGVGDIALSSFTQWNTNRNDLNIQYTHLKAGQTIKSIEVIAWSTDLSDWTISLAQFPPMASFPPSGYSTGVTGVVDRALFSSNLSQHRHIKIDNIDYTAVSDGSVVIGLKGTPLSPSGITNITMYAVIEVI